MVIRSFFRYAGMVDCAQIDIHMRLKKIPPQIGPGRTIEYLSEDALRALLNAPDISKAADHRNRAFMTLMYGAAARCSELLDLRVRDLRLETRYPSVYLTGKGNKTRAVPLMLETVNHCKQYLERFHPSKTRDGSDYFFFTVLHGERHRMSPDNVAYFMKKYGERRGLSALTFQTEYILINFGIPEQSIYTVMVCLCQCCLSLWAMPMWKPLKFTHMPIRR